MLEEWYEYMCGIKSSMVLVMSAKSDMGLRLGSGGDKAVGDYCCIINVYDGVLAIQLAGGGCMV